MSDLDLARVQTFARHVLALETARPTLEELWRAFAEAFPGREPGVSERRLLAAALAHLAAEGVLRLPAAPSWDRGLSPPLPRFVHRVRVAAPAPRKDWRAIAWHPQLAWIPDLVQLSAAELAFLERVQEGLVSGWFAEAAPLKYRSLQLTGHEKVLGRLAEGRLFAAGRLDLGVLGCAPDPTPIVWARLGPSPVALVLENAGSYAVARRVLAGSRYGVVAFGDGSRFERSVLSLREIEGLEAVDYVGDLDTAGLRIAHAAAARARTVRLPVTAASALHAAMLAAAAALGNPLGWPAAARLDAAEALGFIADQQRGQIAEILGAGRRIPEEVLGPRELRDAIERTA